MPKGYGYGGESASSKSGKVGMPGGHAIHKHMSNSAFMKKDGVMDADTEDMPLEKDTTGGRKGSMVQMSYSPMKKYDRVVLGGNKGDKSKTKPGKKDFM